MNRQRVAKGRGGSISGLGRLLPGLFLLLAVSISTIWAQETYRSAYEAGFEDGRQSGQSDSGGQKAYDFANTELYQDADSGFDPAVHEKDVYVLAYRRGFEDGYEKGYGLGGERPNQESETARVDRVVVDRRCRLAEGTEIGVRLLDVLSTQRNERGDSFSAEITEDVLCEDEIAIPVGTRVSGNITHLKRAGRIRGRSEMNMEFVEMKLPSGLKVPITASVVSIEEQADEEVKGSEGTIQGKGTNSRDVKRVGGGTGIGALIGVLAGGGKGAEIGAAVGAVAGVAGTLATRGDDIVLYPQTEMVIKLNREVAVSPDILRRAR